MIPVHVAVVKSTKSAAAKTNNLPFPSVEKVQYKLDFFAYIWYTLHTNGVFQYRRI